MYQANGKDLRVWRLDLDGSFHKQGNLNLDSKMLQCLLYVSDKGAPNLGKPHMF